MSVRLYVGNLAFRLTADEVGAAFARVAPVESVYLPVDRQTGRPRGYGFVEIDGDAAAVESAIQAMNGQPLLGRPIVVHHARPRTLEGGHVERRRDDHPAHGRGPGRAHERHR